jgi:putative oxidoreductase
MPSSPGCVVTPLYAWPKIQNPTAWMGADGPPPAAQAAAAVGEFGGGILLILGLLTRLGALGIGGTMVGALALYHLPQQHPFVAAPPQQTCETAVIYLACAILFLLAGPGRLSLDYCLFRKRAAPATAPAP